MEFLEPPSEAKAQRAWALDVLKRRSWWVQQLSGCHVLRRAARVLGDEEISATERYIQEHGPAHAQD